MIAYMRATRHPWSSVLLLAPLLVAYEGGLFWLGGDQAAQLRDGAAAWVRWGLESFGVGQVLVAPAVVLGVMICWSWWRWGDRPEDAVTTWFGMAFESALFAVALWQLSQNFGPLIDHLGVKMELNARNAHAAQVLTYIGAGIYEEVLFRLGFFVGLTYFLRAVFLPRAIAVTIAALAGALVFAAAHHIGPYGEPMNGYVFLFRAVAGLYFTALFVGRGFGVAVGAHAGYDVLVGVTVS